MTEDRRFGVVAPFLVQIGQFIQEVQIREGHSVVSGREMRGREMPMQETLNKRGDVRGGGDVTGRLSHTARVETRQNRKTTLLLLP